jgi:proteasome activator subunit 4
MDDTAVSPPANAATMPQAVSEASLMPNKYPFVETISRSATPVNPLDNKTPDKFDMEAKRYRPRTFQYFQHLPFKAEPQEQRDAALAGILKQLYIAVKAEDFSPGALHWTRELQAWLNLKFEMTRELRAKLARLYYHMCLAPGLDLTTSDRFARMLVTLTKYGPFLLPAPLDLVILLPCSFPSLPS